MIIMFSRSVDIKSTSIYFVEFHAYGWWQISMENTKNGLMGFRSQTLASNVVCVHDCTVLFLLIVLQSLVFWFFSRVVLSKELLLMRGCVCSEYLRSIIYRERYKNWENMLCNVRGKKSWLLRRILSKETKRLRLKVFP